MYNAQTPVGMGMFTSRSDMPAETPAAYPPHERTGKTAFSKSHTSLFLLYTINKKKTCVYQNWTRTGSLTQHTRNTSLG